MNAAEFVRQQLKDRPSASLEEIRTAATAAKLDPLSSWIKRTYDAIQGAQPAPAAKSETNGVTAAPHRVPAASATSGAVLAHAMVTEAIVSLKHAVKVIGREAVYQILGTMKEE